MRRDTSPTMTVNLLLMLVVVSFVLLGYWMSLETLSAPTHAPTQEPSYNHLAHAPNLKIFNDSDPTVCIITRTYVGQRSVLPAFIASLASNNYPNLHIFLVDVHLNDQPDFTYMSNFADLFNSLYGKTFVHASNVTMKVALNRFPKYPSFDYGYLQTDLMLEQLSQPSNEYGCEYFVATNGDNMYVRDFLGATVQSMREKIDLIGLGFASHYCYEEKVCYVQQTPLFSVGRIDLGAALIRKQKLVASGVYFVLDSLKTDPTGSAVGFYLADGLFYEKLVRYNATTKVIPGVYFIHQ